MEEASGRSLGLLLCREWYRAWKEVGRGGKGGGRGGVLRGRAGRRKADAHTQVVRKRRKGKGTGAAVWLGRRPPRPPLLGGVMGAVFGWVGGWVGYTVGVDLGGLDGMWTDVEA